MTTQQSGDLRKAAQALSEQLVEWRRAMHRHPELGFDLPWTSTFVRQRLEGLGLELHTGLAQSGIAAILRAPQAGGKAVLLRADMDALPIQEVEGRDYGSQIDGRMHACGHDGHTAMLLGAARLLAERRDQLKRDVLFCFQPAEEGGGGAQVMIEEGLLDLADIEAVYGLHLWSPEPACTVQVRPGPFMAAQDEFTARIHGTGGHGAVPQKTRDPILAMAHAITALQSIVARNVDPVQPAVCTVGSIHGGSACNIIPEVVSVEGTLRCFDEATRELLRRRVPEIVEGSAAALGCRGEVEVRHGYPATVNDPAAAEVARRAAIDVVGEERVENPPPIAAAEDFSYFLQQRPGAFVFVGAGNVERGITAEHHSPHFDIDEAALPVGCELLTRLALQAEV